MLEQVALLDTIEPDRGSSSQDFVRYDFLLKENIAVGNIERVADEPAIRTAAERSLAGWICQVASGRRWR